MMFMGFERRCLPMCSLRHPHSGVQILSSYTQGCESSRFAKARFLPWATLRLPPFGGACEGGNCISPLSCDCLGQPFGIIATSSFRTYGQKHGSSEPWNSVREEY